MIEEPKEALDVFGSAVRDLLQDETLIYANPAERAIVNRLSVLLEGRFPGWTISVEWDRREDQIKRLRHGLTEDELMREGAIVPDILIHQVGRRENLLVVEVKKAANKNYAGDIWKLEGLTAQDGDYAYRAGLHLVLDMPSASVRRCDVFINGAIDEELTAWLRGQLP